jgi:rare lipoprotein A
MCIALSSCAKHKQARAPVQPPQPARIGATERGEASWYGEPYNGRRAASGETFDMEQFTAAHRTLPFQTWVQVTNLDNGTQVAVRITDRGPFVDGRIIDLSRAAAREIDLLRTGIARVELRVIEAPPASPDTPTVSASRPGEYTVQAGAFASRERAESLRVSLLSVAQTRLVPTNADPPLWRVWVGNDLTLDLATRLAEEVKSLTGQAVVVRNR